MGSIYVHKGKCICMHANNKVHTQIFSLQTLELARDGRLMQEVGGLVIHGLMLTLAILREET